MDGRLFSGCVDTNQHHWWIVLVSILVYCLLFWHYIIVTVYYITLGPRFYFSLLFNIVTLYYIGIRWDTVHIICICIFISIYIYMYVIYAYCYLVLYLIHIYTYTCMCLYIIYPRDIVVDLTPLCCPWRQWYQGVRGTSVVNM